MQEEYLSSDVSEDINKYIDSIISNYRNLGKKACVSVLKLTQISNGQIHIMLMYSASELQECTIIMKHKKKCECNHILYIHMVLDNKLNLIQTNYETAYINDLYNIVLNIIQKFNKKID